MSDLPRRALSLLFMMAAVASAGPADIRGYRPQPGTRYRISETTTLHSEIGPEESPQITDKKAVRQYLLRALSTGEWEITFERVELGAAYADQQENYDYSSLIGRTVELHLAANGDLRQEKGFDQLPEIEGFAGVTPTVEYRDNILRLFPILPPSPPRPDRPAATSGSETIVAWSTPITREFERTYTVQDASDTLTIDESSAFRGHGSRQAPFSVSGTGTATYELRFQEGGMPRSLALRSEQRGTAVIGDNPSTAMPVRMLVETEVRYERLPEQR